MVLGKLVGVGDSAFPEKVVHMEGCDRRPLSGECDLESFHGNDGSASELHFLRGTPCKRFFLVDGF